MLMKGNSLMNSHDRTCVPDGVEALGLSQAPTRPRTKAEEYAEMKRRRAAFRKVIADYEASRGEYDESSYQVWW